jgi:hypothetical protein
MGRGINAIRADGKGNQCKWKNKIENGKSNENRTRMFWVLQVDLLCAIRADGKGKKRNENRTSTVISRMFNHRLNLEKKQHFTASKNLWSCRI